MHVWGGVSRGYTYHHIWVNPRCVYTYTHTCVYIYIYMHTWLELRVNPRLNRHYRWMCIYMYIYICMHTYRLACLLCSATWSSLAQWAERGPNRNRPAPQREGGRSASRRWWRQAATNPRLRSSPIRQGTHKRVLTFSRNKCTCKETLQFRGVHPSPIRKRA